ncbi:MAG: crotonase/enoyl-CoA hydratase family protein [Sandaracinaceae bacterium]
MSEPNEPRIVIERDGAVAHVVMNRPDKRNGLDLEMFEGLVEAGRTLATDRAVRAVVLSGRGKAFCAGLDFMAFLAAPTTGERLLARSGDSPANLAQATAWVWREVPVPVIAAIHGQAFGGGLQIALGADLRYVAPDAQLSVMEIRWGLVPDMGASQTLLRVVRPDIAKELTWTGRVVSGEEAVALGLATRTAEDPLAAAMETAQGIAGRSPDAIRRAKALYDAVPTLSVADGLALETALQVELLGSPNQMEAVRANFEKRPPRFDDPS